jgi:hypothetical protein
MRQNLPVLAFTILILARAGAAWAGSVPSDASHEAPAVSEGADAPPTLSPRSVGPFSAGQLPIPLALAEAEAGALPVMMFDPMADRAEPLTASADATCWAAASPGALFSWEDPPPPPPLAQWGRFPGGGSLEDLLKKHFDNPRNLLFLFRRGPATDLPEPTSLALWVVAGSLALGYYCFWTRRRQLVAAVKCIKIAVA